MHRGEFPDAVRTRVAQRLGDIIIDIAEDALQSFASSAVPGVAEMRIELVRPHDDPSFADVLVHQLAAGHPAWAARTVIVEEDVRVQPPDLIDWTIARRTASGGRGTGAKPPRTARAARV